MTTCLSDLRLDELLTRELPEPPAHLAGCAACQARYAALAADRDRFRAARPALTRDRPWRTAALAIGALAAAVLIVMLPRNEGTRTKGGAHLGFAVLHRGVLRAGAVGEVVHPGDTLSYLVTTAEPAYLTVLGRDAAGQITTYVPAARVAAGRDVQLATGTLLDGTLGREELVAVFCARATAVTSADAPPAGCTLDRLVIEKAP